MKLHTLALISALAVSGATLSHAQMTQPGATGTATGTGTAPTTPPTHPTERGTPSTMSPGNADGAKGRDANSAAEGKQTCKNLSSAEERATCMQAAKKGHSGSKSKSGMGATDASGVNQDSNGSGTGYSRPESKP